MNIFYLDSSPEQCAKWHCDKHTVKMIVETAQLLSTAHRLLDGNDNPNLYKVTHINHPTAKWVRQSNNNYNWTVCLFEELLKEYTYRYGKVHKCQAMLGTLKKVPKNIPIAHFTAPPQCMPDDVKADNTVTAYRNYYNVYKSNFCKWKNRETPEWFVKHG